MKLSTKSLIYRLTRIDLAAKERAAHIKLLESNLSNSSIPSEEYEFFLSIGIGVWECDNGFYRPFSFLSFKRPAIIFIPLAYIVETFVAIKREFEKQ